ncbi:MAG: hypothetical protein Q8O42_02960 [Acidobacteriota bacterium]|nr:hypothetical protein [Acidobacteriota bacterium]
MNARRGSAAVIDMTNHDNDVVVIVTERFERRLAEENGKLRVEMATEFGKVRAEMATGFGSLRAEMSDRNAELLKWGLVFGITQTAAIAGVVALLR